MGAREGHGVDIMLYVKAIIEWVHMARNGCIIENLSKAG